jgi:hypothetical protein
MTPVRIQVELKSRLNEQAFRDEKVALSYIEKVSRKELEELVLKHTGINCEPKKLSKERLLLRLPAEIRRELAAPLSDPSNPEPGFA